MAQVTFNCLKLYAIFIQNEVKFIVTLAVLPADISLATSADPPLKGILEVFVINSIVSPQELYKITDRHK